MIDQGDITLFLAQHLIYIYQPVQILFFGIRDAIPTVIDICEKEKVDVILPFITAELPIMAENRELLESHGVKVSISSMESILASGNKVELAKHYPT